MRHQLVIDRLELDVKARDLAFFELGTAAEFALQQACGLVFDLSREVTELRAGAACDCVSFHCGLCGKRCCGCCEGGSDEYPEFCDDCWHYVLLENGRDDLIDNDTPAHLEREMIRIMRRLVQEPAR